MGRIKSTMVKKTAKKLLVEREAYFSESFEDNKKALSSTMPSKPIRNKVAGYLSRLVAMKKAGPRPKRIPKATTELHSYSDNRSY